MIKAAKFYGLNKNTVKYLWQQFRKKNLIYGRKKRIVKAQCEIQ